MQHVTLKNESQLINKFATRRGASYQNMNYYEDLFLVFFYFYVRSFTAYVVCDTIYIHVRTYLIKICSSTIVTERRKKRKKGTCYDVALRQVASRRVASREARKRKAAAEGERERERTRRKRAHARGTERGRADRRGSGVGGIERVRGHGSYGIALTFDLIPFQFFSRPRVDPYQSYLELASTWCSTRPRDSLSTYRCCRLAFLPKKKFLSLFLIGLQARREATWPKRTNSER